MLGGTGLINGDKVPGTPGRLDAGETTMEGGDGFDWMAGDNAIIRRVLVDGKWVVNTFNAGKQHERIYLIDINSVDAAVVSGGDLVLGQNDDDVMYGQGGNDEMHGGAGMDYMEGNAASDDMYGDTGQDDMVGGTGLVNDDPYDPPSNVGTNGRFDANDVMRGESDKTVGSGTSGGDVMLGDNAVVVRTSPTWAAMPPDGKVARVVYRLDVENLGTDPATTIDFRGDDEM
jgi:hypothetical protein